MRPIFYSIRMRSPRNSVQYILDPRYSLSSSLFHGTLWRQVGMEVAGEGPLVVCSPGLGDSRDAFAPLAAHLVSDGCRVICVDLRVHGDSTADFARYGGELTADDLLAVDRQVRWGPAILVGASMSFAAQSSWRGRRPDQVVGLVLIGVLPSEWTWASHAGDPAVRTDTAVGTRRMARGRPPRCGPAWVARRSSGRSDRRRW